MPIAPGIFQANMFDSPSNPSTPSTPSTSSTLNMEVDAYQAEVDRLIALHPGFYENPDFVISDNDTYAVVLEACILPFLHSILPEILGTSLIMANLRGPPGPDGNEGNITIITPERTGSETNEEVKRHVAEMAGDDRIISIFTPKETDELQRDEIEQYLRRLIPRSEPGVQIRFTKGGPEKTEEASSKNN
ncbi:hypothetical protein B0O99DRAFT_592040 [Bisporella sp. PMI_857]|nr:hypothetical protein B0O99DRAFT_592040 [Bisporella sp. PMI_857]